jgi:hypothetical protein
MLTERVRHWVRKLEGKEGREGGVAIQGCVPMLTERVRHWVRKLEGKEGKGE